MKNLPQIYTNTCLILSSLLVPLNRVQGRSLLIPPSSNVSEELPLVDIPQLSETGAKISPGHFLSHLVQEPDPNRSRPASRAQHSLTTPSSFHFGHNTTQHNTTCHSSPQYRPPLPQAKTLLLPPPQQPSTASRTSHRNPEMPIRI